MKYLNFRKDQFIHRRKTCNQLAMAAIARAQVHGKWKITRSLTGNMEFTGLSIFT